MSRRARWSIQRRRQAGEKGHGKGGSGITTAAMAQTVLAFARNQEIITHPVVGRLPRLSSFGGLEGSSCSTTWGLRLFWPTSAKPPASILSQRRGLEHLAPLPQKRLRTDRVVL